MDSLFGGDSLGKKSDDTPSSAGAVRGNFVLQWLENLQFCTGGKTKEFALDEKYKKPAADTKVAAPSAARRSDPLDFGG